MGFRSCELFVFCATMMRAFACSVSFNGQARMHVLAFLEVDVCTQICAGRQLLLSRKRSLYSPTLVFPAWSYQLSPIRLVREHEQQCARRFGMGHVSALGVRGQGEKK